MSTSVYFAWRSGTPEPGEWSPVARLDREGGTGNTPANSAHVA
jgi:hypothetical protein